MSLSKLNSKASHGTGSKGTLKSLVKGTKKTGKTPFPSMARGPIRDKARRAGVG